jgi:hypothetical protein
LENRNIQTQRSNQYAHKQRARVASLTLVVNEIWASAKEVPTTSGPSQAINWTAAGAWYKGRGVRPAIRLSIREKVAVRQAQACDGSGAGGGITQSAGGTPPGACGVAWWWARRCRRTVGLRSAACVVVGACPTATAPRSRAAGRCRRLGPATSTHARRSVYAAVGQHDLFSVLG